jgi:hypothetical protein
MPPDFEELARRFGALYTGALTDVLDKRGRLEQTLPSKLQPLRSGMTLAGPAWPIEGRPRARIDYDVSARSPLTTSLYTSATIAPPRISASCPSPHSRRAVVPEPSSTEDVATSPIFSSGTSPSSPATPLLRTACRVGT